MKKIQIVFLLFLSIQNNYGQIIEKNWENCSKYLGNVSRDLSSYNITTTPDNWLSYWNQVTPSNAGKWGFVEEERDVMKWEGLDKAYYLAKSNNLKFKQHVFVWGNQQPEWIDDLSNEEQLEEIEEWISEFCTRYPATDQIDVVNEARSNKPNGGLRGNGTYRANYIQALGGQGETGIDWIIKAFELARKHCPNAELILNDYGILNNPSNRESHIEIANILKGLNLIDAIGVQGHSFTIENMTREQLKLALDQLGETDLPIYISELDLDAEGSNPETTQLNRYQELFPVMWEHPDIAGITLWGYIKDDIWREDAYLVLGPSINAQERPAMQWIKNYVNSTNSGCDNVGPVLSIEVEDNMAFGFYPNPVNKGSSIDLMLEKDIISINIISPRGKLLYQKDIDQFTRSIKISLEEGLYLIEGIKNDGKKIIKKLLVK